jgi:anti-repressor protein
MENTIQIFNHPSFGEVRVIEKNGEPMFCATDICNSLGYSNTSKTISDNVDDCDRYNQQLERGGSMIFVNESGMYSLVLRSNMPKAKEYKHWVTTEVLPSIRKYGAYMTEQTLEKALLNPDYIIKLAKTLKEEKQKRIEAEQRNAALEIINKEQAPKAAFTDAVIASSSSCLIGELAKILTQNGYNIGQNRLFATLRDKGYLGTRGEYYNMPNQQYVEQGIFEIKKSVHSENGVMKTASTPKVTGKGQVYFVNKFLNR